MTALGQGILTLKNAQRECTGHVKTFSSYITTLLTPPATPTHTHTHTRPTYAQGFGPSVPFGQAGLVSAS